MKNLAILFIFSLFAFISCKDATTDPEADYPLKPFNTDVIRPLSVGNYWTVNFIVKDSVIGNATATVIDSTIKIYNGEEVTVFTTEIEYSSSDSINSYDYEFVFGNRTYHTCDISNNEITECFECIPYRYIGDAKSEFIEEESSFDGKTVTRLKSKSDNEQIQSYFVIGVGKIISTLPVRIKESNERTTMTTKLVDYHIVR